MHVLSKPSVVLKSDGTKKMAAPKYLQYSMKLMRDRGFTCEKTEQKVGNPKQRFMTSRDLFGFMDALAFSPEEGSIVGVQATSAKCISAHKKKYRESPDVIKFIDDWLRTSDSCELEMHGWKKVKNRWKADIYTVIVHNGELVWVKEEADL